MPPGQTARYEANSDDVMWAITIQITWIQAMQTRVATMQHPDSRLQVSVSQDSSGPGVVRALPLYRSVN